jgi:hypothetical protein
VLIAGFLAPANLLDITRNFVTFDRKKDTGKVVRKVPRYKQFIAVNKALARSKSGKRVEGICLDIIDHYTKSIQPNGFKAQVVTSSRECAVHYKETLDRLNAPESAVVFSSSNDDKAHLVKWATDKEQRTRIIERFQKANDPLSILVVCDMLLTGFDAPIEQVMYLDSSLKEHTLLQAIARVNRVYDETKPYGLVVDYWGVSEALQEALSIFSPTDVRGVLTPKSDELPRLQARHQAAATIPACFAKSMCSSRCYWAVFRSGSYCGDAARGHPCCCTSQRPRARRALPRQRTSNRALGARSDSSWRMGSRSARETALIAATCLTAKPEKFREQLLRAVGSD